MSRRSPPCGRVVCAAVSATAMLALLISMRFSPWHSLIAQTEYAGYQISNAQQSQDFLEGRRLQPLQSLIAETRDASQQISNDRNWVGNSLQAYNFSEGRRLKAKSRVPIYRFWQPVSLNYFYTTSSSPPSGRNGYKAEGIGFYAFGSKASGTVPIYRFDHNSDPDHLYSTSPSAPAGYTAYGIEFYAFANAVPGSVRIHQFYHGGDKHHFYSTSPITPNGYYAAGIAFHAFKQAGPPFKCDGIEQSVGEVYDFSSPFILNMKITTSRTRTGGIFQARSNGHTTVEVYWKRRRNRKGQKRRTRMCLHLAQPSCVSASSNCPVRSDCIPANRRQDYQVEVRWDGSTASWKVDGVSQGAWPTQSGFGSETPTVCTSVSNGKRWKGSIKELTFQKALPFFDCIGAAQNVGKVYDFSRPFVLKGEITTKAQQKSDGTIFDAKSTGNTGVGIAKSTGNTGVGFFWKSDGKQLCLHLGQPSCEQDFNKCLVKSNCVSATRRQPHQVEVRWDGSTASWEVDGRLKGSWTTHEGFGIDTPVVCSSAWKGPWKGIIKDLIYQKARTRFPIYRYYSPSSKNHFYTTSPTTPAGYKAEGIEFYAFAYAEPGTVPIYRFYHSSQREYLYTTSPTTPAGFTADGFGFYALAYAAPSSVPIYRFYHEVDKDRLYTTSSTAPAGYIAEGIEFYAFTQE